MMKAPAAAAKPGLVASTEDAHPGLTGTTLQRTRFAAGWSLTPGARHHLKT